jgi:exosome complex exonuclease DIS3/RRP44
MLDRIFMKKTRRGNILKIVREHYLRDDLGCGSQLCANETCNSSSNKIVLESKPSLKNTILLDAHYIVPDTNIILHQVRPTLMFFLPIYLYTYITR